MEVAFEQGRHFVFAPYLYQWLPLVKSRQGPSVSSVRLVSPGWVNGTADWKMEPLLEVWRGREPGEGQHAYVFVMGDGRRYSLSECNTPEEQITRLKRVYKAAGGPETMPRLRRTELWQRSGSG